MKSRKSKSRKKVRGHHLDRRTNQILAVEPPGAADDDLLTTEQIAEWFGLSTQWFEIGRVKGYGPEFIKLAPRCVRYTRAAAREYLRKRSHASTAEYRKR